MKAVNTITRPGAGSPELRKRRTRERGWILLFLLPFLACFLAFTLWPIAASIYWSFTNFRIPSPNLSFVGLQNFRELFHDPLYRRSFANTLIFAVGNTIVKLPLSLVLALLLTRKWALGKRFFRTVYFLPIVVPTALVGLIFAFLLHPLNGALPAILRELHIIGARTDIFFANRTTTMSTIILVSVWQIFGQYLIYWMAALQGVPDSVSDAAQIDGANFWQELVFVTLPSIRPLAIIILFLGLVNAFSVFGIVLTLTAGGPGAQSYVMQLWVYDRAFTQMPFRYGYISAGGVLFALFVLLVFAFQTIFVGRAQSGTSTVAR